MKTVLIIGSKGMAGHVIYNYFKENGKYVVKDIARGTDFHIPTYKLDVTNFKELGAAIESEKPDIVINCIGILNKDAEDNPDKAILLNSYLPHFLAKTGKDIGFKLVHISTDCVFNGAKGGYTEKSIKDGIGFYAQSKAIGEVGYGNNLTIRTSIIGPELKSGIGLFHWFMSQKGTINGYKQAYWTGVTTIELARAIIDAIDQDIIGIHHLVNNEKISKYDLISIFKEVFEKNNLEILPSEEYKIDKSLIKTNNAFNYSVPSYRTMIVQMQQWIKRHPNLYTYQ